MVKKELLAGIITLILMVGIVFFLPKYDTYGVILIPLFIIFILITLIGGPIIISQIIKEQKNSIKKNNLEYKKSKNYWRIFTYLSVIGFIIGLILFEIYKNYLGLTLSSISAIYILIGLKIIFSKHP